jgi:hypothetical protein
MSPEILRVYLYEIQNQCIIAMQAAEDMRREFESAIAKQDARFWYCLQAFLSAAANISKLLRYDHVQDRERPNARQVAQERATELRRVLQVNPDSVLLLPRDLRNHIEHMDERLDAWAESAGDDKQASLHVRVIQPGTPELLGFPPERCFLYFDAMNWAVTFKGTPFDVPPIAWEVNAIGERAAELLAGPMQD